MVRPFPFVSYPVRCMRILELLGMLGLLEQEIDQNNQVPPGNSRIHGAVHPRPMWEPRISLRIDRAVSIVAASLLLAASGKIAVVQFIPHSEYEVDRGLLRRGKLRAWRALTGAEETAYFLGSPFDYIELLQRKESFAPSRRFSISLLFWN